MLTAWVTYALLLVQIQYAIGMQVRGQGGSPDTFPSLQYASTWGTCRCWLNTWRIVRVTSALLLAVSFLGSCSVAAWSDPIIALRICNAIQLSTTATAAIPLAVPVLQWKQKNRPSLVKGDLKQDWCSMFPRKTQCFRWSVIHLQALILTFPASCYFVL